MYAYMFLMLFTIGAMSAASMGVLNINNTTQKTLKAADDARILTLWENSIGAALLNVGANGELSPPNGQSDTKAIPFMTPPSWISAPRNNAYGYPIVYCPVAQSTKLNSALPIEQIKTKNSSYSGNLLTATSGHDYIISSNIALDASIVRSNVLAILISPLSAEIPSCSDITYNEQKGKFYVAGNAGIVRVITAANKINNGSDDKNSNSAVDYSATLKSWATTTGDDYTILASTLGSFNAAVSIEKYDSNNTVLIKSDSLSTISGKGNGLEISGIKLILQNIDLRNVGSIHISNGELVLQNSYVGSLTAERSKITLTGNSVIQGDTNLIDADIYQSNSSVSVVTSGLALQASKWTMTNNSSLAIDSTSKSPLTLAAGSSFTTTSSSMSIKGNRSSSDYMIVVDPTSQLALNSSSLSLDTKATWGIFDQGTLQINNSSIIPTAAASYLIGVYDGGKIFANLSSIGSSSKRNAYGIVLESSSYASGSQTNIYSGSQCLAGTAYNTYRKTADSTSYSYSWSCK